MIYPTDHSSPKRKRHPLGGVINLIPQWGDIGTRYGVEPVGGWYRSGDGSQGRICVLVLYIEEISLSLSLF